MIKDFKKYIAESTSEITFSFGRFNPPTIGHEKLMNACARIAKRGSYRIYASKSSDAKKNPLQYSDKIKFMRKLFPKHARNIIDDPSVRNVFDICTKLYDENYSIVNMVVGSDRVNEFDALINKYNGVHGPHGFYNFQGGVNVFSAGERDPDEEGVTGMSASKLRAAAADNNLQLFSSGLPQGFKEVKDLFNAVRKGLGLNESHNFRKHVQLEPVSIERENFITGNLFAVDEDVIVKETNEIARIIIIGPNYVIVEHDGKRTRKWLTDIEPIITEKKSEADDLRKEKADKDIQDKIADRKKEDKEDAEDERDERKKERDKQTFKRLMKVAQRRDELKRNAEKNKPKE